MVIFSVFFFFSVKSRDKGGVFPESMIKNFLKRKRAECAELAKIPHPAEFEKYFNL